VASTGSVTIGNASFTKSNLGARTVEYQATFGSGNPAGTAVINEVGIYLNSTAESQIAARIVLGPRGAYYDHPFDNFARTAHIWTGVLYSKLRDGETVSPEDVAMCMVGVKVAREAFRHKRDNLTDAHGYLLTLEMVLEERDRRERDAD